MLALQERASSVSSNPAKATPAPARNKRKLGQNDHDSRGSTPAPTSLYDDAATGQAASLPTLVPTSLPGFYATRNHPSNKPTFRYTACGPSPQSTATFPLFRVVKSPPTGTVRFSWEDKSTYVNVTQDASTITTEKGFRSARANVPIREGAWYFEVIIDKGMNGEDTGDAQHSGKVDAFGPHVRLGIARREAPLNGPAGFDGYSYGLRDKTGDKVHLSQPRAYGEAFGTGDVIGVYVSLPSRQAIGCPPIPANHPDYHRDPYVPSRIVRKRVPIRYKGQLYFEAMEYAPSKEMEDLAFQTRDPAGYQKTLLEAEEKKKKAKLPPPPGKKKPPPLPVLPPAREVPVLPGSKIAFFKNGECMGVAYENLLDWLPLRQHYKPGLYASSGLGQTQPQQPIAASAVGTSSIQDRQQQQDLAPAENGASQPAVPRVSTATAILMARENHHDDGSLGYYPFVSVFGGAIASLHAGPDFRYPPPDEIDSLLANHPKHPPTFHHDLMHSQARCRPLSERYEEYYAEMSEYDSIDEAIALENYAKTGSSHVTADGRPYFLPSPATGNTPAGGTATPSGNPTRSASPVPSLNGYGPGGLPNSLGRATKRKTALSKELLLEAPGAGLIESRESTPASGAPSPMPEQVLIAAPHLSGQAAGLLGPEDVVPDSAHSETSFSASMQQTGNETLTLEEVSPPVVLQDDQFVTDDQKVEFHQAGESVFEQARDGGEAPLAVLDDPPALEEKSEEAVKMEIDV